METQLPQIEIVKYSPVGVWTFDIDVVECRICWNKITQSCVNCCSKKKKEVCVVSKGMCGHGFHRDCLREFFNKSIGGNMCPICKTPWNYKKENLSESVSLSQLVNGTKNQDKPQPKKAAAKAKAKDVAKKAMETIFGDSEFVTKYPKKSSNDSETDEVPNEECISNKKYVKK